MLLLIANNVDCSLSGIQALHEGVACQKQCGSDASADFLIYLQFCL